MRLVFTFLLMMCCTFSLFAQDNLSAINGVIIDGETNEGLVGATVMLEGTDFGTITDLDGSFTLNAEVGTYQMLVTYVGYETMRQEVNLTGGVMNAGQLKMGLDAIGLSEVNVIASVAVDRKTPVAVTTLKAEEIEAKVGNQEFPEVLRSTPSVYVTKSGGGFGDARINLRGFDQRNTAVMINGVPVNDMENGWVYWSNWAGLSEVASSFQVQRGLGASRLAVPSVGGSLNIVTNAAEISRKATVRVGVGNDGYQKAGLVLSSGLMDNGWAVSAQFTHTRGNGFVDGTQFRAYSYFLSTSKRFNDKNTISLTVLGAPQWHHQRTINNFDDVSLYTYAFERGIRFNNLWGSKDGEEFSWRRNFYHKPKAFLNHYLTINDKMDLKTSVYASIGRGGGTGPRGRINSENNGRIYDSSNLTRNREGQVLWDDITAWNAGQAVNTDIWGQKEANDDGPFAGQYSTTRSGEGWIRRASMNEHNWFGVLSTLNNQVNENFNWKVGLDGRYYVGAHYRRVDDLLGNDAYLSTANVNNPENYISNPEGSIDDGNILNYHNDGRVSWMGLFTELEYSKNDFTAYLTLSGSNQGFQRVDYFNYEDSDEAQTSEMQNFLGGVAKAGVNWNIGSKANLFANGGYISRQPIFDNVFVNFRNDLNPLVKNQTIYTYELGYGWRSDNFRFNANLYNTFWLDRGINDNVQIVVDNEERDLFASFYLDQHHRGLEFEGEYSLSRYISFNGMFSLGDWRYINETEATLFDLENNTEVEGGNIKIDIDDEKVGDAAQTTFSVGMAVKPISGLTIRVEGNHAANLYSQFDISNFDIFEQVDSGEVIPTYAPVKLPSFTLLDASVSYKFNIGDIGVTANANVYNIMDTKYIAEMTTNNADFPVGSTQFLRANKGWYGFGRTWSAGLKFNF